MNETRAKIERVERLNATTMLIEVAPVDGEALQQIKAGQTVLARLHDDDGDDNPTWHPYLRDQWWVAGITRSHLLRVERPFTHRYQPGQVVNLLGPIGQPYRFRKSLRNVLLLAYDTSPTPLTIMARHLLGNDVSVTLVLLGAAREYETQHLPPEIEVIRGAVALDWDDMTMTLGWADQIFTVVNLDDEHLHFLEVLHTVQEKRADVPKNYLFGVFRPLLPCGVGACHACVVRQGSELLPICRKGPALDLTRIHLTPSR